MPKEEWGVKRVCPTTGKRFYDLGRDPVVSPYTGEVVQLDTGKGSRVLIREEKDTKPKPEAASEDDETSIIEDEADVLEDDDTDVDLGDDVLDDDDESDNVSLDDIADMSSDDDDN